jgi:hypothetical protein
MSCVFLTTPVAFGAQESIITFCWHYSSTSVFVDFLFKTLSAISVTLKFFETKMLGVSLLQQVYPYDSLLFHRLHLSAIVTQEILSPDTVLSLCN